MIKVNTRLKIKTGEYDGTNWLIASFGLDSGLGQEVYITTDRVRASEFWGDSLDYAKVMAGAPKMYYLLKEALDSELDEEKTKEIIKEIEEGGI